MGYDQQLQENLVLIDQLPTMCTVGEYVDENWWLTDSIWFPFMAECIQNPTFIDSPESLSNIPVLL